MCEHFNIEKLGIVPYTCDDALVACLPRYVSRKTDEEAFDFGQYFGKSATNQAHAGSLLAFKPLLVALAETQPRFRFKALALRSILSFVV